MFFIMSEINGIVFLDEPQQKPKPLIEDQRRQMLLEAKKKFTSKAYYNESSMPPL